MNTLTILITRPILNLHIIIKYDLHSSLPSQCLELYVSESTAHTLNGYLMFVAAFVFLIVMVMMNLLNGLVVRDIKDTQNKTKIYTY